jgi:hypothetical protein
MTITLPDGYNGHTVQFDTNPIEFDGEWVRLRCVSPGKEWIRLWLHIPYVCKHCKLLRAD